MEDGKEVRPHHYIRSILPEGPIGLNGVLKSGDELLEVNNGHYIVTTRLVPDQAHFLSSSSFIKFKIVEFEHESSSNAAPVFRVTAQGIRVSRVFFEL